jgi:hypothetical protein
MKEKDLNEFHESNAELPISVALPAKSIHILRHEKRRELNGQRKKMFTKYIFRDLSDGLLGI